ncbi:hypothetical protein ACLIIZ_03450 [Azonexus caeni]|uniref:hypothetical protein n=1 Tax=Azonexus caeni TaxID=266126 RepID=UPI003A8B7970
MKLDTGELSQAILAAFQGSLHERWPEIREYGESEAKKLVMIEALQASGKITPAQAALHLEIQKNACRSVLLTLEGLGLLAVEAALDAALDVVRETVNGALGFALL